MIRYGGEFWNDRPAASTTITPSCGARFERTDEVRREKLASITDLGLEPFGRKYNLTHHAEEITSRFSELENQEVRIAGRIMSLRGHGKTSFVHLADLTGRIQLYFRQDVVGEEAYSLFQLADIGDIIGVAGSVFRTQKGEISVRVTEFEILAKSLRPLPEKWHGAKRCRNAVSSALS